MKRIISFGLLGLLLAACSNQDVPAPDEQTSTGNRFMTIKIASTSTSSRADYDDGDGDEYKVLDKEHIVFFFFDDNGNAVSINDSGNNYVTGKDVIEWTKDKDKDGKDITDNSTTAYSQVMVVLENQQGLDAPTQVVAVLNSPVTFTNQTYTLQQLRKIDLSTADKTATVDGEVKVVGHTLAGTVENEAESKTYYTMTNSVYYDKTSDSFVYATPIPAGCLASSQDEAKNNPVTIYVERVVSKVELNTIGEVENFVVKDAETSISITDEISKESTVDLSIVINGWGLFNEPSQARLIKDITDIKDDWANSAADHRSFWGITPDAYRNTLIDPKVSWAEIASNQDALYTLPNTLSSTTTATTSTDANTDANTTQSTTIVTDVNTSIYVAATIGTKDDAGKFTGLTFGKWLSKYYTEAGLKTAIAKFLANYLFTNENGVATSITADDIDFSSTDPSTGVVADGYHVFVVLSEKGKKDKTWYSDKTLSSTYTAAEVQSKVLNTVPKAQIWTGGKCYYFTTVNHGLSGTDVPGVVRNHWYKIDISKIIGLGTPVYREDDIIDPTLPNKEEDYWYLDATIGVQAWRIITQSTVLDSTK